MGVPPPAPPVPFPLHYKWAVVLCKYADVDSIPMQDGQPKQPADKAFFENMISEKGKGTGNLYDYILGQSYGAVDFAGSTVVDWHTMSARYDQVGKNKRPGDGVTTCINEAQNLIDFTKYDGIMPVLNQPADAGSTGNGPQTMTLNGVTRGWAIVADVPTLFSATFLAHEMGHSAWAWNHSTDAAGNDYGDMFDIMSAMRCGYQDVANYSHIGPGMSAAYKIAQGWMPSSRIATFNGGSMTTDLAALDHPEVNAPLVARVPLADGSYYSIEFRRSTDPKGIDAGILDYTGTKRYERDPIVIEKVTSVPALMTTGASGPWGGFHVGDSFDDSVSHIKITVLSVDAANNRATVRIERIGFSLAVNESSTSLSAGDTESLVITTTIAGCSPVQLSATTTAPGTTAGVSQSSVATSGDTYLYLGVDNTTPPESGVVTVSGTCGGVTQTATVQLTTSACIRRQCSQSDCGNVSDGCGGTLDCGPCDPPHPSCGTPKQCCLANDCAWRNGRCFCI